MTTCASARPAPFRCPTLPERIAATLALLPTGRAWAADSGRASAPHDPAFDGNAFDPAAFDTRAVQGTILYRFWAAVAAVYHFIELRLCDLRLEFFCATMRETRDLWLIDYGLPDECDPYPDVCAKAAAIGGARCEYYQAVAARLGWSITCSDEVDGCGSQAGCDQVGLALAGTATACVLKLTVYLNESPAFTGAIVPPPQAGCMVAGTPLQCADVDIVGLRCVIERIAQAHVRVDYITV
ncbi:MAG: hypothetical protein GC182_08495 [Rhodopseudomonas sp.]|nr:hypothetical protein [Rhodopseudomonas sp.]